MMTPTIVICGQRNTGKTSWVCALISRLKLEGLKVGSVKHTHHRHDVEGKDTDRHQQAGAGKVLLISKHGSALYCAWDEEPDLSDIVNVHFGSYDLVFAEGYRRSPLPKMIVDNDPDASHEDIIFHLPAAPGGTIDEAKLEEAIQIVIARIKK